MSNIRSIRGGGGTREERPQSQKDMLDVLDQVKQMVSNGELQAIFIVGVGTNDAETVVIKSGEIGFVRHVGMLEVMKYQVLASSGLRG